MTWNRILVFMKHLLYRFVWRSWISPWPAVNNNIKISIIEKFWSTTLIRPVKRHSVSIQHCKGYGLNWEADVSLDCKLQRANNSSCRWFIRSWWLTHKRSKNGKKIMLLKWNFDAIVAWMLARVIVPLAAVVCKVRKIFPYCIWGGKWI